MGVACASREGLERRQDAGDPAVSVPTGRYVLVTPVKDEIRTIGTTIDCVTRQTCLPVEWVIVDDGSTDGTSEALRRAACRYDWITPLSCPPRSGRNFASVVEVTLAGIQALQGRDYEFLGLLDADLRFEPHYFEHLIARFRERPRLGLAGGMVVDIGERMDKPPRNREDVPGATQLFRKDCFDSLGGLLAIPEGGWDTLTCAVARMRGFETALVTDLIVDHLKPRNIAYGSPLKRAWQLGERDYAVGNGFAFETLKWIGRSTSPRRALRSVSAWLGYCAAAMSRRERVVPADLVGFIRREQRTRLTALLRPGTRGSHD